MPKLTDEDYLKAGEIPKCIVGEDKTTIPQIPKYIMPRDFTLEHVTTEDTSRRLQTCNHGSPKGSFCPQCATEYYNMWKKHREPTSLNNGGKTDYYQLDSAPFKINDFDDFAEWRQLNGNQFNIGKVAWTFNVGRHSGTDYQRDLNKIIHYAKRELERIARENSSN